MSVFEPKYSSPITIRLGANSYILADGLNKEDTSLDSKAAIFMGIHYGMNIINDENKTYNYGTQRRIEKVKIQDDYLIIYEEGKSIPWKINMKGEIVARAKFDEEKDLRYVTKALNLKKRDISKLNSYEPLIELKDYLINPQVSNPIIIFLNDDKRVKKAFHQVSPTIITKDSEEEMDFFNTRDNSHFGFKVIGAKKSITYPTQCPVYSVFVEEGKNGRIIIRERGKFHPWQLSKKSDVLHYARFDTWREEDANYLKQNFDIDKKDIETVNSYGLKYKR